MIYHKLSNLAYEMGLSIYDRTMPYKMKGLYADGHIWINRSISTLTEKGCILAEEIGHHITSHGNILDLRDIKNRKQELRARQWAYEMIIPLSSLVQAHHARVKGRYELAEYLGVTEEFLQNSIDRYFDKYGKYTTVDNYIIYFEPLGIVEMFE